MTEPCPQSFIELAQRLADSSGDVVKKYFRAGLAVDVKPDRSPVTTADREAESAIRTILADAAPDHGIIGEEHGSLQAAADHVWVIDPIDGTKSFVTGKPTFGTLIALTRGGIPILGVIDQPITGERWLGAAGRATTLNGEPCATRRCGALDQAFLNTTSPDMFAGEEAGRFARLAGSVRHALYGGDCYAYGLLALGLIDLVVEANLKTFDYCALVPVIEGAGGVITDWRGDSLTLDSDGRVVAAGDAECHALALAVLGG